MKHILRDPVKRGYVVMAVGGLLALALLLPFVLGSEGRHLSAYRDGKEDASSFREAVATRVSRVDALLATPSALRDVDDPARTLYVAIGAEREYDDDEVDAILGFLDRGGRVLLADETGFGTPIAYEAGFAFEAQRVLDTRSHLGNASFPVATVTVGGGDSTAYRVVFNLPGKLTPLPSRVGFHETLASTSDAQFPNGSYVDEDENGLIDRGEAPGPFPLLVRADVGRGVLVLVADTGPFMNAQMGLGEYQNDEFVAALVSSLVPRDGVLLLDESRHLPPAALAPWSDAMRQLARATTGPVAPFVLLGLLALLTILGWRLTRDTEDWSHHAFDVGRPLPTPPQVRPDLDRLQRLARRRISEKYNIPVEQVAAMTTDELAATTGDRTLAEAASGALRADPTPLFSAYAPSPTPPEVTP